MKQINSIFAFLLVLTFSNVARTQTGSPGEVVLGSQNGTATSPRYPEKSATAATTLDARQEKTAMQVFLKSVQKQIVSAAEAMPADKYGFAPTDGEFKGVRTFGQQVKHLSATNHILAAAALGEEVPADAGDEVGPETVRTKAEILD
jgi:hypothetical protein